MYTDTLQSNSYAKTTTTTTTTTEAEKLTVLKILNIDKNMIDDVNVTPEKKNNKHELPTNNNEQVAAVQFEAINIDNNLVQRHPRVSLNVVEIRVALAMCFLEFREINDRL